MNRIKRARQRRPAELIRHGWFELKSIRDRFRSSPIVGLPDTFLCNTFHTQTIDELWRAIANQPYPLITAISAPKHFEEAALDEPQRAREPRGGPWLIRLMCWVPGRFDWRCLWINFILKRP